MSQPVSEVVDRLKALLADEASSDDVSSAFKDDVPRLLDFVEKSVDVAEKAHALLANAYSTQDAEGIRINSEDAVKLQWALREVGIGDDSGEPCFSL